MVWGEQSRPLPVELWLHELERLANWCEKATAGEDDRAVRRAFHLSLLAPLGILRLSTPAISLDDLDQMLDDGETQAAGIAVIGSNASIDVTQIPDSDQWIGSYGIGDEPPVYSEAPTPAAAMIRAWATFFSVAE